MRVFFYFIFVNIDTDGIRLHTEAEEQMNE